MKAPIIEYPVVDDGYRKRTATLFNSMPFVKFLGIELIDFGPGWLDCGVEIRPELTQQHGYGHAGLVATLADMSAGIAACTLLPDGSDTLSLEFKISLMRPSVGERLIAKGRVIKPGQRISFAESWIYSVKGAKETLCARGYISLAIRR